MTKKTTKPKQTPAQRRAAAKANAEEQFGAAPAAEAVEAQQAGLPEQHSGAPEMAEHVAADPAETPEPDTGDDEEPIDASMQLEISGPGFMMPDTIAGIGNGQRRSLTPGKDVAPEATTFGIHTDAAPAGWVAVRWQALQYVVQRLGGEKAVTVDDSGMFSAGGVMFGKQQQGMFYLRMNVDTNESGEPQVPQSCEQIMDAVSQTMKVDHKTLAQSNEADQMAQKLGIPLGPG